MTYEHEPWEVDEEQKVMDAGGGWGFHGTRSELVGDRLEPTVEADLKSHSISSDQVVNYMAGGIHEETSTQAEKDAWNWGGFSKDRETRSFDSRVRVHKVEGEGELSPDLNITGHSLGVGWAEQEISGGRSYPESLSMASPSAKVTDTQWTPPPSTQTMHKGFGVQGTLPHINWKQFGAGNVQNIMTVDPEARTFDMRNPDQIDNDVSPPWEVSDTNPPSRTGQPLTQVDGQRKLPF